MSSKLKLTILIVVAVLAISGIALFIYGYFESRNNGKTIGQSIIDIFPRSNNATTTPNGQGGETEEPTDTDPIPVEKDPYISRLQKISTAPVSGGFFSSTSTIRFIDKASGNIYEYSHYTKTNRKITSTTIPRIHDSYWLNKDVFVARYLNSDNETISSFVGTINNPGDRGVVITDFLPVNIKSVAVSPKKDFFFYIVKNGSFADGVIYNLAKKTAKNVASLPNPEFTAVWGLDGIFVHNNASFGLPGYLLKVQQTGGDAEFVLGPIEGLTVKPISGGFALSSFKSNTNSFIYSTKTREYSQIMSVIVPEKCVTTSKYLYCATDIAKTKNGFPDNWYRGEIQLNDILEKIELENPANVSQEYTTVLSNEKLDMVNLSLSQDEKALLFMNNVDNSLWSLELE